MIFLKDVLIFSKNSYKLSKKNIFSYVPRETSGYKHQNYFLGNIYFEIFTTKKTKQIIITKK